MFEGGFVMMCPHERVVKFLCEERGRVDRGKKDGGMMEKPQRILRHKQSF